MNTLLTNEMKAILLVLCSQESNPKETAQAEVENLENRVTQAVKCYSTKEEKKSYLENLKALTPEEFEILLPFLKIPIGESFLSKDRIRSLRYNNIHEFWHLFTQDWAYFPDKKLDVNEVLKHLTYVIDPKFCLDFVLCFPKEQKERLQKELLQ